MSTMTMNQAEIIGGERISAGAPGKLSWSALIGAAFVVMALFALLDSIGLAVGLWAIDLAVPESIGAARTGMGIWSVVSSFGALFVGGLLASRTAGIVGRTVGAIHGMVLWGVHTVLSIVLVLNGGRALGGAWSDRTGGVPLLPTADEVGDAMGLLFLVLLAGLASATLGAALGVTTKQRVGAEAQVPMPIAPPREVHP